MTHITQNYMFDDPMDMVRLAKEVQTCVYWGSYFYLSEEGEEFSYRLLFWDVIEEYIEKGYKGVSIRNNVVSIIK